MYSKNHVFFHCSNVSHASLTSGKNPQGFPVTPSAYSKKKKKKDDLQSLEYQVVLGMILSISKPQMLDSKKTWNNNHQLYLTTRHH